MRRLGRCAAAAIALWALAGAGAARAQDEKPEPPPIFVDEPDDSGTGSQPPPQQDDARSGCVPPCREGFMCHEGECVSACNPPCGANEVCTGKRECVPRQGTAPPQPPSRQPPAGGYRQPGGSVQGGGYAQPTGAQYGPGAPAPPGASPRRPISTGWGRGAAAWGLLNIPILIGGATAIFVVDDSSIGAPVGGALTVYSGIATAVVGAGSASPGGPGVRSMVGTIVPGWILYAASIVSAVGLLAATALAIDETQEPPASLAYVPAGFASLSNLFFAITGFVEAARAENARPLPSRASASRLHLAPVVLSTPGEGPTGSGLALGGRL